jgi:hypothetical protein
MKQPLLVKRLLLTVLVLVISAAAQTAQAAPDVVDPIVGTWAWKIGETVTFDAKGICVLENTKLTGTWQFLNNPESERKYRLTWDRGRFINKVIFSRDGRSAIVYDETDNNKHWNVRKLIESAIPPSSGGPATANPFGTNR